MLRVVGFNGIEPVSFFYFFFFLIDFKRYRKDNGDATVGGPKRHD